LISACALVALCSVAQAQSNVTIYGRLDASMLHVGGPVSKTAVEDGIGATSNIGFRGKEDLGAGLSAIFDLEAKVAVQNGAVGAASNSGTFRTSTSAVFSRNSYVGLQSTGWGAVTLGRNYTSAVRALYNMNAIPVGINTGLAGNVAPQGIGNDFWNNGQVKYDSPEFGGFSVMANYAPGGVANSTSKGTSYGAAATFKTGGLVLTAGHQKDEDIASANSLNWSVLTASYTMGALKIAAGYDRVKNPTKIAGWVDSKMWTLGAAYRIAPALTIAAQYFDTRETATGTDSKQLVMNAQYAFSKRTSVYAMLTHTDNGALAVMPLYGTAGIANSKANSYAMGLQHLF
jgi:predicted porin